MRFVATTFLMGLLLTVGNGCGRSNNVPAKTAVLQRNDSISMINFAGGNGEGGGAGDVNDKRTSTDLQRKVIYNAHVYLIVEDLDALNGSLGSLLKKHDAKIASEDRSGSKGQSRTGTWKVRVPVKEFESFFAALSQLGELERTSTNSQDVTEEYYDLAARIEQKTVEEKGLLKLQEEAAAILNKDPKARMEDLLAVRKEWASVRQEIERMQGRLKLLTHLTELTTVTITVNERKGYVPPTQPGFGTQIGRTFEGSISGLSKFGQGIVLVAVAMAPWLAVLAVVLLPAILAFRWFRRRPPVASSNS